MTTESNFNVADYCFDKCHVRTEVIVLMPALLEEIELNMIYTFFYEKRGSGNSTKSSLI